MENINTIIAEIEKYGFKVREHANVEMGKLNEECPVVYEIYNAKTHRTLYGAGTVGPESLEKWLAWMVKRYGEKTTTEPETTESEPIQADVEKEKEYDRLYNEGGEGFNPYRAGSVPTYRTSRNPTGPIEPTEI